MAMFEGYKCPVCENTFVKQDDIVVCPDCGAPYHRECYLNNSGCVYSEKHAEGFVWKGEKESEPVAAETIRCAKCGTENPVNSTVCSDCGAYLRTPTYGAQGTNTSYPPNYSENPQADYEQIENEEISGIRVGDFKKYLGNSWFFSLPAFYNIGKYGKKLSLNVFALLTHGIWFIWKKMYGIGILILAIMSGIYIFEIAVADLIEPLVEYVEKSDTAGVMAFMEANPLLTNAYMACGIIQIAIYAYCALNANNAHYRHCVRKIKKIRKNHSDDAAYAKKLDNAGNASFASVLIACLAYMCIQMLAAKYSDVIVQVRDMIYTFFTSGDVISKLSGIL